METGFDGDGLNLNPRQSLEPDLDRQKDGREDDQDRQAKAEYHFNPLEETEGSVPYTSHKDHIGRPGLKEDDQADEGDADDHVDQPAKAGMNLGDILNSETGKNGPNPDSHAHNSYGNKEDAHRGDDHHKLGDMEEYVGEDDQDLRQEEKGNQ